MVTPNFFCSWDVLNSLIRLNYDVLEEYIDFTMDLIDEPYWFSFRSGEKTQSLKVYKQRDLYSRDEEKATEKGSLVIYKESGQAEVRAVPDIKENMAPFYRTCHNLSCFVQEKRLETLYADLDPEESGILLEEKNGEMSWKVVSGRARPSLMVENLFGQTGMIRPYFQDFIERDELESCDSLDKKVEAAERGNATAMEALAVTYLNGDEEEGIAPDPEKSVFWFKKLAELGDPVAMFNLGLLYAKGYGAERDFKQAAYWVEQAAEGGDNDAPKLIDTYKNLANSYEKAIQGDAQAQADLAVGLMKLGGSLSQAGSESPSRHLPPCSSASTSR